MFNAKVLVVSALMVIGKLSILAVGSNAYAYEASPRFFEYHANIFINRLINVSFGWNKSLSDPDKEQHYQSLTHAVNMAENGQIVRWYGDKASGYAVPVVTWPTGSGYCRRVHSQIIAYNTEKTSTATACYDQSNARWHWTSDK